MACAVGALDVRARVPHKCELCGTTIPIGTRHHRWAWVDSGSVRTLRAHRSCERVLREVDDCDEWSEPPVRAYFADDRVRDGMGRLVLHPDPPHLIVVGDDLAGEWRAVWAALKAGLDAKGEDASS